MNKLIVVVGALALTLAGTAIALADDSGTVTFVAQTDEESVVGERPSWCTESVLDELVEEGVITQAQADAIVERLEQRRAEHEAEGFGRRGRGFGHFRGLPDGFELPEGFEFPDDFELRAPIEIPEDVMAELEALMDTLREEFDLPMRGHVFGFPGGSFGDYLEDGELSQDELADLEALMRERLEQFRERFESRFDTNADEAVFSA